MNTAEDLFKVACEMRRTHRPNTEVVRPTNEKILDSLYIAAAAIPYWPEEDYRWWALLWLISAVKDNKLVLPDG